MRRLTKSHHPVKFGGHRYCGSGDIIVLACHVITQDHMIKQSCDLMGGSPLLFRLALEYFLQC